MEVAEAEEAEAEEVAEEAEAAVVVVVVAAAAAAAAAEAEAGATSSRTISARLQAFLDPLASDQSLGARTASRRHAGPLHRVSVPSPAGARQPASPARASTFPNFVA